MTNSCRSPHFTFTQLALRPGDVLAVCALRDDAFRAMAARFLEDACFLILHMFADTDGLIVKAIEQVCQHFLALNERQGAQTVAVQMQDDRRRSNGARALRLPEKRPAVRRSC